MSALRKVAIVTGAGTGIGKGVALALLREDYFVALAGRRAEILEKTLDEAGPGKKIFLLNQKEITAHA